MDVSSSYYESCTCPLARFGHDRDGVTGLPIIVYGVIKDIAGRPIAVDAYPENTNGKKTSSSRSQSCGSRSGCLVRSWLLPGSGVAHQETAERCGDCNEGWPGSGALQDEQAFHVHLWRREICLGARGRIDPTGRWTGTMFCVQADRSSACGARFAASNEDLNFPLSLRK
jgi:hypothetical protein